MASKLFAESDSWGDLNENGNSLTFSTKKSYKKEKESKSRKRNYSEIEESSEGGKWVR